MSEEFVITESAMKKVLSNDETLRLKCMVETLHDKVIELQKQLGDCNGSCKKEKKHAKG